MSINESYIQDIVNAMAKANIIPNNTEISGTQIAGIIENINRTNSINYNK